MSTYSTVVWQPDDEITSAKLQQMSDNEQYCFDNLMKGQLVFSYTYALNSSNASTTKFFGYPGPGTGACNKIVGVYAPFEYNGSSTTQLVWQIKYPNIFTNRPVISATMATGGSFRLQCYIYDDSRSDQCSIAVLQADNSSQQIWAGAVHLVIVGS